MILVTGGAGFIGSNFIHMWLGQKLQGVRPYREKETLFPEQLMSLDKLNYAGNLHNVEIWMKHPSYSFFQGDIGSKDFIFNLLKTHKPRAIINFAAESHVDRSIHGPEEFVLTNVLGTFHLLESVKTYYEKVLTNEEKNEFRFLHISTDEVYGSLGPQDPPFSEKNQYAPNSPYSASKASSDHFVRAFHHTYGLPVLTTNCSNNYGPYQFPEKLIPLMIYQATQEKRLPIYGNGMNIRDWLYVEDHCRAIAQVLERGTIGETYNVGGHCELTNTRVVEMICSILDELIPRKSGEKYSTLIQFVKDRPGHDMRYAIDDTKIRTALQWSPQETFQSGLRKTIQWYLSNKEWVEQVTSGKYREWIKKNY